MRRTSLSLLAILLMGLLFPPKASAFFDWLEHMSGPGPFRGWMFQARLMCFGKEEDSEAIRAMQARTALRKRLASELQTPTRNIVEAFETLYADLRTQSKNSLVDFDNLNLQPKTVDDLPTLENLRKFGDLHTAFTELTFLSNSFEENPSPSAERELFARLRDARDFLSTRTSSFFRSRCATCSAPDSAEDMRAREARTTAVNDAMNKFVNAGALSLLAFGGVTYSACPIDKDAVRTSSIDLLVRNLHTYQSSSDYAGGHQINMVTLVPTVSWRPLHGISEKLDYVDLSVGAGMYWFSDGEGLGTFDGFSGWIIEPLRFDFHFPSVLTKKHKLLALPSLHYGLSVLPAGIDRGAFGNGSDGQPSKRIPAEWLQNIGFFVDVTPAIYWLKNRGPRFN